MPGSLGPGFTLGEKKKKIGVSKKKFGELSEWGGSLERGKATRPPLGSTIFFVLRLFLPLRSLVPGYMPGQNDHQTESLTGKMVIFNSTLSVDWPLFRALNKLGNNLKSPLTRKMQKQQV